MIVVDSSGWLEYFTGDRLCQKFAPYIEKTAEVVVPSLVLYEVYRWLKKNGLEEEALKYIARMSEGKIIPLNDSLALHAADISLEYKLAMADSIVYATALSSGIKLVTADSDFKDLPSVIYIS